MIRTRHYSNTPPVVCSQDSLCTSHSLKRALGAGDGEGPASNYHLVQHVRELSVRWALDAGHVELDLHVTVERDWYVQIALDVIALGPISIVDSDDEVKGC